MRPTVIFGGKSFSDFEAFIAESNMFDSPVRSVESIKIPGRNGTLHISDGSFMNFTHNVRMYIPVSFITNAHGLRNYLLSKDGYCRYEETQNPEEYRMARFIDRFAPELSNPRAGYFTLSFDCKPQRFLKSGEQVVGFETNSTIYNPTEYEAKPLIRVYGAGYLGVGNNTIQISRGAVSYIDIDCDIMDCYEGTANRNNLITMTQFPDLPPGPSGIVLGEGITRVEITPRWWRI